ncbi:hypothetical protein PoB_005363700 [Plakobranchus ocellatus]|uniref:Uncharacterized protein n=1 Tax=Plakobranchus ocellatus TaxID=259542 RepID=A0AAV4C6B4_9GAST|nr:hypothetical protein PoB_005363700 [Plakobranchus ocellatus]
MQGQKDGTARKKKIVEMNRSDITEHGFSLNSTTSQLQQFSSNGDGYTVNRPTLMTSKKGRKSGIDWVITPAPQIVPVGFCEIAQYSPRFRLGPLKARVGLATQQRTSGGYPF